MPTTIDDRVAELERKNAELARELEARIGELKEARERQAAASAVLEAISRSPADASPVFEAIVEGATRLCRAEFTAVARFEGGLLHLVATNKLAAAEKAAFHSLFPRPPLRNFAMGRAFLDGGPVQFADVLAEPDYDPTTRAVLQSVIQYRSFLGAPILRQGRPVGVIGCGRREVRPVTEDEIAILQTFAGQAAIALENARLIAETQEALDQQTATAEVLQVINASPGDLAPVFEAILLKAHKLCEASFGGLMIYDGDRFRPVALQGVPAPFAEFIRQGIRPEPGNPFDRMVDGAALSHIPDLSQVAAEYPNDSLPRAAVDLGGIRTFLAVPLRKDNALIGAITAYRQEVRPFSDKQIALLQNFAGQAVIAMENARLLTETREALAQQTATAEVLQVINSSPGDLTPVFDAMLEKAMRLCGAAFGIFAVYDGEHYRVTATHGLPARLAEFVRQAIRVDPGSMPDRLRRGESTIQVPDIAALGPDLRTPGLAAMIELGDARTAVWVPLRKDGVAQGFFGVYRREVRPFSDKQLALLQNFAAQAVIAMENARLITETREALDQQTATSEVLGIISSSPGRLEPVFDAILASAVRVCAGKTGMLALVEDGGFRGVAVHGIGSEFAAALSRLHHPPPGTGLDLLQKALHTIQIADCAADPAYDAVRALNPGFAAVRTALHVPMIRDAELLGAIAVYRDQVRPFNDKEVNLVENFAKQAVIAIENTRLITEIREALEQQTATAEVLQVINSSPGDLAPVFDAMIRKAVPLCGAAQGSLRIFDGEALHLAAWHGDPRFVDRARELGPIVPRPGHPMEPLLRGEPVIHLADAREAAAESGDLAVQERVAVANIRSWLAVALRKDGALLGTIAVSRHEVRPFSEKEITLLENFAAQAVIAMENARLLTETREALEQQTATAEVLQVINSSPGDLAPVFDAMLEKATRLCEAPFGILRTWDGERFHFGAVHGDPRFCDWVRQRGPVQTDSDASLLGRIRAGERVVHITDAQNDEAYRASAGFREMAEASGVRSAITVALHKDDALLGIITVYRQEVRPFSDKQIALLQNFAAQAVIAMENARLLTETREALEQQTATAEVLQVINSSPGDLAPVFEAMLEKATRLCGASLGTLWAYDGERMHPLAMRGASREYAEYLSHEPLRPGAGALGRFVRGETLLHVVDLKDTDAYRNGDTHRRALVDLGGGRSLLGVPLRTDDRLRGAFLIYRREPQPFTDKQIALLQNFAAQAVIAMENARLLTETREALEQQTATSEVLQVINSSPGDLAPVFDAMLERAMRLCDAAFGGLWTFDDDRYVAVAARGVPSAYSAFLAEATMMPGPGTAPYRFLRGERLIHNIDLASEEPYLAGDPQRRALVDLGGARTALQVPLRKDGIILGVITIYRQQVRPFSDKQIAVLENFAGQAVIAMENARLLGELRQRTRDLEESLEYQVAVGDVLKIISRSAFDLETVLQTVVTTAVRLCRADSATIYRNISGEYRWAAGHMLVPEYEQIEREVRITPDRGTLVGRAVTEGRTVQILDAWTDPLYEPKHDARIGGVHTMLGLPLLREGVPIGAIGLARRRVEAFSEREVQLVTTFADQAVIAIENARLLGELRERTEELAAREAELRITFDNMADGVAMFDAELQLAAWNRNFQELLELPDAFVAERPRFADYFRYLAERGEYGSSELEAELSPSMADTGREARLERTRPNGRIIEVRRNPAPGGGFVLIYSDITERKRAEEAIRAARDAAETALRDLQTAQASLVHAQKMAALGQLTAGVAHEIKNPLNFVNNFAGLSVELLDELKETTGPVLASLGGDARAELDDIVETLTGNLNKIAEHGRRADGIVKSMLEHSRSGSSERRWIDINALIDEALNLAYHGARAEYQGFNIALDRDLERDIAPIEVMPQDLTRVFLNLFGNGFYAADKRRRAAPDAEFRPALSVATRDLGETVEIRVRDNGTGIAPEFRDKLFQPFFTTKPTGEGTGLGLSISYDIVTQQHGGTISVDSKLGEFTEFTIRLPRRTAAAGAQNH